ncbi:MAG: transporter substrate-binding domain-containing protein [Lachnospiraceae bacterium]|nr:transporter substrate-binding domain-containing protein [Lachnospiraceae bacterium]
MKKRLFALALAACMTASLTACGGSKEAETTAAATETAAETAASEAASEAESTEAAKAEIKTITEGKLTVATSPDFAPYEFYAIGADGTPELAGFDMALAQYIADYLGLELEVVTVDFDGVLSELQTKSVDLGMAGLSPDEKRMGIMDFSDLYYKGGQSLVTVKANADVYNSFEAINKPEVSVGAQTGSIQMDLANTNSPDADIVALPKVTDIIAELLAGKLDAAYIEKDVAISYQKNYPDLELVMDVPYEVEGSAIGVCKGNEALLAGVNEAIAAALSDGSMEQFIADANELASGEKYEGLLDENGNVQ